MSVIDSLTERAAAFTASRYSPALKIMPSTKTIIIGCLDPRADPTDIFDLAPGEAAVLRNVGGRLDPATLQALTLLRSVVQVRSGGGDIAAGWNLVVMHHTDCGIGNCLTAAPELLGKYMGVDPAGLAALAITDPYASVRLDVAALKASPDVAAGVTVTGMVYDVATGKVEVVVPAEATHGAG